MSRFKLAKNRNTFLILRAGTDAQQAQFFECSVMLAFIGALLIIEYLYDPLFEHCIIAHFSLHYTCTIHCATRTNCANQQHNRGNKSTVYMQQRQHVTAPRSRDSSDTGEAACETRSRSSCSLCSCDTGAEVAAATQAATKEQGSYDTQEQRQLQHTGATHKSRLRQLRQSQGG